MRPLVFARRVGEYYKVEALNGHDLAGLVESLDRDGIAYTSRIGRENSLHISVDQEDVDRDIWARNLVDDNCNLIELDEHFSLSHLHEDLRVDLEDYREAKDKPSYITAQDYEAMVLLNRCAETALNEGKTETLLDELDKEKAINPPIAFRAFLQLYDYIKG